MRRRHFVSLLGTPIFGGCLSSAGSSSPPELGRISIVNHTYERHTVHLLIERDGDPVYWTDHTATAGDDTGPGGTVVPCAWGDGAGEYVVRARLDGRREWRSIDLTDYDSDVIGLSLQIGNTNTERRDTPDLTIWHTGNPNARCTEATATTESR